jgi:V8-like Glu-specific endopeptidase
MAMFIPVAMVVSVFAGEPVPDTTKVIALSGRFSMAQACPVSPYLALTAGHVVDPSPFNMGVSLLPYMGQSAVWQGIIQGLRTYWTMDLAWAFPDTDFPSWYELGSEPKAGERLWWVGYDWRNAKRGFERRLFSGEVTRSVAGTLFIDAETYPGSSGSCVLNAEGKVVGIISAVTGMESQEPVVMVVGVWAPWFKLPTDEEVKELSGR